MDIRLLPEHENFRDEVRRFLDSALTTICATARDSAGRFQDYETTCVAPDSVPQGLDRAELAEVEYGGTGWDDDAASHLDHRSGPRGSAAGLRRWGSACGPDADRPRHAGAARLLFAAHAAPAKTTGARAIPNRKPARTSPALQLRADIDGEDYVTQRHEDLDDPRAPCEPDVLSRAHRHFGVSRRQGMTFLLLDMDTPGVSVEPICSCPANTK